MTRNCYNVMRKIASYATQWGNKHGYTAAELAPYMHLITPSTNRRVESIVHERIHAARVAARTAQSQVAVEASRRRGSGTFGGPQTPATQYGQSNQPVQPLRQDLPAPQPDPSPNNAVNSQAGLTPPTPPQPAQAPEQMGLEFSSIGL
jgi:hypothetical protein